MSTSSKPSPPPTGGSRNWTVKQYTPRHTSWPYQPSDFTRQDESTDTSFYSSPRFVTHIDDAAIASLREYYDGALPKKGRILDFCSSWISHYPKSVEDAVDHRQLEVIGMGMNAGELDANKILNGGAILHDLNNDPDVTVPLKQAKSAPSISNQASGFLDASTCVVSIDYLTKPLPVLQSLLSATKPGGSVHLTISNRCFPTKAVGRWLRVSEAERLQMVGDYLFFAGWKDIEIVELSNGAVEGEDEQHGGLRGFMSMMGMGGRDPLWIVRAKKL